MKETSGATRMPDLKRLRFRHVLLLLLLVLCQASSASEDFAIVNINVIPMDEERLLENQVVVVSGGVIQSVSDVAATSLPADLLQIDGEGRYLMPGLADLHVHLRNSDEILRNLAWGVTTVMHLGGSGGPGQEILRYREEIRNGTRLGPTIYTTDRILDGDPAIATGALSLKTADEAKTAVRNLKAQGFDFVKIYNNVSLPVFTAIVAEAEAQGLPVFGHIPRNFDALLALSSGQDAVVHTEEFFFAYFDGPRSTANMSRDYAADLGKLPALITVLSESNVAVMPDLSFAFGNLLMWDSLENVWNDAEFPFLHPDTASLWEARNLNRRDDLENFILREQWKYNLMQTLTLEFQDAGILQVIGTDASLPGLFPGKAVHRELTELVKAGLSNYDALAIGTRNAGTFVERYLDNDARLGQIRPGYRADLIILRDNPLEDVRNARLIDAVVAQGVYTDRAELDKLRAEQRE